MSQAAPTPAELTLQQGHFYGRDGLLRRRYVGDANSSVDGYWFLSWKWLVFWIIRIHLNLIVVGDLANILYSLWHRVNE